MTMKPQPTNSSDAGSEDLLYTLEEAANRLKVSKWTVYRLIETGDLKSITIRSRRVVRASDIANFIERQIATPPEFSHER
jgi:excisionase family DNA binding protein